MTDDVQSRIDITVTATGADEAKAKLDKLGQSHDGLSVQSDKLSKMQVGLQNSFERWSRTLDDSYRGTQNYAKAQLDLERAVAGGVTSQTRANELLALAKARYLETGEATGVLAKGMDLAKDAAREFAGEFGAAGFAVASIGAPALIALGALGGLYLAFDKLTEKANEFATDMLKVRNASQATGVSTTQFQAIAEKAAVFGVSEDKAASSMERFAAQMEEFRRRTGPLYEGVVRIDDGLAQMMVRARDGATEFDLFTKVLNKAGDSATALGKTAFGKGGYDFGLAAKDIGGTGGLEAAVHHAGDAIQSELIDKVTRLKTESDDMAERASRNFASIFSVRVLQGQKDWNEKWLELSRVARDFSLSPSLSKLLDVVAKGSPLVLPALQAATSLTPGGAAVNAVDMLRQRPAAQELAPHATAVQNILAGKDMTDLDAARGKIDAATQAVNELGKELGGLGSKAAAGGDAAAHSVEGVSAAIGHAKEDTRDFNETFKDFFENRLKTGEDIRRQFDTASTAIAKTKNELDDLYAGLNAGGDESKYQPAINAARVQLKTEQDAAAETERHNRIVLALAQSYRGVSTATAEAFVHQQGELNLANATTQTEKLRATQVAAINNYLLQGKSVYEATALAANERLIAETQINAQLEKQLANAEAVTNQEKISLMDENERAVAIAQANTGAQQQMQTLRDQIQLANTRNEEEKNAVTIAQTYNKAIRDGVDAQFALKLAVTQRAAIEAQAAQAQEAAIAAETAALIAKENAASDAASTSASGHTTASGAYGAQASVILIAMSNRARNLGITLQDLETYNGFGRNAQDPDIVKAIETGIPVSKIKADNAAAQQAAADAAAKAAAAAADAAAKAAIVNAPENVYSRRIIAGEAPGSVFTDILAGHGGGLDLQTQLAFATRAGETPAQELAQLQSGQLGAGSTNAEILSAIESLQQAITANTDATVANTGALSPYYDVDPRTSHLGYRTGSSALTYDPFTQPATNSGKPVPPAAIDPGPSAAPPPTNDNTTAAYRPDAGLHETFADGGIMTSRGRVPLRRYEGGGIASSPQYAMFGEGSGPEAFVPLKNGAIPVTVRTPIAAPGRLDNRPIEVHIHIYGDVTQDTLNDLKMSAFQSAQILRRQLSAA